MSNENENKGVSAETAAALSAANPQAITPSGFSASIADAPARKAILSDDEITMHGINAGLSLANDPDATAHTIELVVKAAEGGARYALVAADKRINELEKALWNYAVADPICQGGPCGNKRVGGDPSCKCEWPHCSEARYIKGPHEACDALGITGIHWSDCAMHNMPAEPNGPCDCGANAPLMITEARAFLNKNVKP